MLAGDGSMNVVGFIIVVAFILEDMKEWADISIRITFTFEADGGNKIALVISISWFGEKSFGGEFELFFE